MSGHDGEQCDVVSTIGRRARKGHRCDGCERSIRPGDHYITQTFIYDGHVSRFKRCGACQRVYRHLCDRLDAVKAWDEYPEPDLGCGHGYRERWEEDPPAEIAALAFMTDAEASALLSPAPTEPKEQPSE